MAKNPPSDAGDTGLVLGPGAEIPHAMGQLRPCSATRELAAAAAKSLSCVRVCASPWTAAHQAPPCMGFSRQESWSGVPLPSPETWYTVTAEPLHHSKRFQVQQLRPYMLQLRLDPAN